VELARRFLACARKRLIPVDASADTKNSMSHPGEAAVGGFLSRVTSTLVVLGTAVSVLSAGENPQQAFAKNWEGRTVVLKQTLYTLVYDERSRIGMVREGKRDGLTVVTPFEGTYLQFDGRRGRDDIKETEPQRLKDSVATTYISDALFELEASRTIVPIVVNRHDAGVECVVKKVQLDRYSVRLLLVSPGGGDGDQNSLTSLTVKWPVPFSKSLSERDSIENLIRRFVEIKQTR
jgi:hypothetical protein